MNIEILYEDGDILAINKPAGLVVHPDGKTAEPSVSEWFVSKYPAAKEVGEPIELANGEKIERPGIVHRIDRETSGVLLLAKTSRGHACLKEQFQAHEIDKKYHAFLYGALKDDHGTINLPIGKSNSDFRKRSAERGAKGELREAVTYLPSDEEDPRVYLRRGEAEDRPHSPDPRALQGSPAPGRGDTLYARTKAPILGFERLALHAREVKFTNTEGEQKTVKAPYPEDFKRSRRHDRTSCVRLVRL
jgi:23S rRNA pseudouridine1911/1915/1917 synthase